MKNPEIAKLCLELMATAPMAVLSTIDADGFPQTRAMLNLRNPKLFPGCSPLFKAHDNDFMVYFTTNTSSVKMQHITKNNRVSVYYCQPESWHGLMLSGRIAVVTDMKEKLKVWQDGWEMYYPKGPTDPDSTILKLLPDYAKFYHQLRVDTIQFKDRS